MTDDPARALELFGELCDLTPAERDRRLAALGLEPGLEAAVRGMLSADGAPHPVLDGGGEGSVEAVFSRPSTARPSDVGGFRILGELGRGGMSVVYEAEQPGADRRVALKVLRPTSVSTELLERLAREGRILGRLEHPGIARIYATGTWASPDGPQPFLAMELVEGKPLDQFARDAQLDVPARVELAAHVAEAVHHAHGRGVLHRDLKPSNVLVRADGTPAVLDFGVARALDRELTIAAETESGALVGTLRYMSPEQAAGETTALDAGSDVYALGILLYELLSGESPYPLDHTPLHQAARVIVEREPTRLGVFDRSLAGDLETIVAKALEKERAARYRTAGEFAADLRRFLADEPIAARPPSTLYQLRKFARRNRALVAGAAAVLLVAVVGAAVSTGLYLESIDNLERARVAEAEWRDAARVAEAKATTAERTADFLVDLFDVSDPTGERGAEIRARDLLDRGRLTIEASLEHEPLIRGDLLATMGRAYQKLGEYDVAIELLEGAVDDLTDEAPPLERARAQFLLGEAHHYRGDLPSARAGYEPAVAAVREALEDARRTATRPSLFCATVLDVYGRLFRDEGDLARSRELALEAQALRQADPSIAPLELTESLQSLGTLALIEGQTDEAERLIGEALEIRRGLGPRGEARVPELLHMLSSVLRNRGRIEEAEAMLREGLALTESIFGAGHQFHVLTLLELVYVLSQQDELGEAAAILAEVDATLASDHPMRPRLATDRAGLLEELGRLDEAIVVHREAIAGYVANPGADWRSVTIARNNLGAALSKQGRFDESKPVFEAVLDQWRTKDERSGHLAMTLRNLAEAQSALGEHEAAIANARESLQREAALYGEDSPRWREAARYLGRAYAAAGQLDEANQWAERGATSR